VKLSLIRDLKSLRLVLKDPEAVGPDPAYWVFSEIGGLWNNITLIAPGNYNGEFPKTFGHYHETHVNEKIHVIEGKGVMLLQKRLVENGNPISEKIEAVPEEVEEKPKKSKPASEAEELEEAIKSLGLFKEMEKGKFEISKKKPGIFERLLKKEEKSTPIKEEKISPEKKFFEKEVVKAKEKVKEEKPKIKLTGKSKAFGKCYKALHEAKESISKGNAAKAKKLYLEVRNLYMSMEYHEKKEVYGELMDLYNSLK